MTPSFKCFRASSNETRLFANYADALDFVMREGDLNRLWTIEEIAAK